MSNRKKPKPQADLNQAAAQFAKERRLNPRRVKAVFHRLAEASLLIPSQPLLSPTLVAFYIKQPENALEAFEREDLRALMQKAGLVAYLVMPVIPTPFYTLPELAALTRLFIVHLEKNKDHLLKTGFPITTFGYSRWFDVNLSKLYFVKAPYYKGPHTVVPTTPDLALPGLLENKKFITSHQSLQIEYIWARESCKTEPVNPAILSTENGHQYYQLKRPSEEWTPCLYEDVPYLELITREDAKCLDEMRPQLFDLKIAVLMRLSEAAEKQYMGNLWDDCLQILRPTLLAERVDFLMRMDKIISHLIIDSYPSENSPLQGVINRYGGLSDLLEIIGHFEREISSQTMHTTKNRMFTILPDGVFMMYFQALGQPWRADLDKVLEEFLKLDKEGADFWKEYRDRVNDALANEFEEEVVISTKVKRRLIHKFEPAVKTYSEWTKKHLESTGKLPPSEAILTEPMEFRIDEMKRKVYYKGKTYKLTVDQIKIVKYLYEQYKAGTPLCHWTEVVKKALGRLPRDSESGLSTAFKSKPDAWKDLFIRPRGYIRLNLPDSTE